MTTSQPDDFIVAILVVAITVGTWAACYLAVLLYRALRDALLPEDSVN